jgi:hypothetical protein
VFKQDAQLQRYEDGDISDANVFAIAEGLT